MVVFEAGKFLLTGKLKLGGGEGGWKGWGRGGGGQRTGQGGQGKEGGGYDQHLEEAVGQEGWEGEGGRGKYLAVQDHSTASSSGPSQQYQHVSTKNKKVALTYPDCQKTNERGKERGHTHF